MSRIAKVRKAQHRIQVIGLCRFSYLGEGGFKTLYDRPLTERRAMLFDPDRLNARMIWFEHVFLPSLQAQTDPDFTMIVLTSEDLPQPWLDRLRALIGALPQFRLQTMPPLAHRVACADAIKAVVEPGADLTAQFRLDDDDAVAVEYIALIRRDFLLLHALYSENNGLAVDYTLGLVLEDVQGRVVADKRRECFWGCGLTLYLPPNSSRQILNFQHHKVWQHLPTVMRHKPAMWVRGAHQSNDSKFRRPDAGAAPKPGEISQELYDRFRIDLKALEARLARYHAGR